MAYDNMIRLPQETFDPCKLMHEKGWIVVPEMEDRRSLEMVLIDMRFVTRLSVKKAHVAESIEGGERLKRIQATGLVRLHPAFLPAIFRKPFKLPESWRIGADTYTGFDGAVLRDKNGHNHTVGVVTNGLHNAFLHVTKMQGEPCYDPSAVLIG